MASGSYLCRMRAVGLKTLKNKLSEYLRFVAGGVTVPATDRDRVAAEIVPPRAPVAPLDTLLRELAADRDGR